MVSGKRFVGAGEIPAVVDDARVLV